MIVSYDPDTTDHQDNKSFYTVNISYIAFMSFIKIF